MSETDRYFVSCKSCGRDIPAQVLQDWAPTWEFQVSCPSCRDKHLYTKGKDARQFAVPLGFFNGRHYTEYVETVNDLMRQRRHEEAEDLLLNLVEAVERESAAKNWGVPPWYHERLAVLFRKEGGPEAEVLILERYQQHALGSDAFSKRLEKARTLLARSRANP